MNKKLIAIAISGAMAAPMAANAEVSLSGLMQVEVASVSGDGAAKEGLRVQDGMEYGTDENAGNASALFVNIAEDVGGGMKAIGKIGFNFQPADHANGFGGRDAYVGLAGGFGTVLAGRMNTPYKASTVGWDPFLTTSLQARGSFGMSALHNGYAEDVIAYSNTFGNIKFVGGIAIDDNDVAGGDVADDDGNFPDGETDGDHGVTFSVNAPVGPVEVAVAYIARPGFEEDNTAVKAGAKWESGPISVAGQFETMDENAGDGSQLYVTGGYTLGNNTFAASVGSFTDDSDAENDATYMALGVKHAMSKTVGIHAGFRSNDRDADNSDESVVVAGMRLKF